MKAEDRALETYPVLMCYNDSQMVEEDINKPLREIYQEGYHQAEKDLELTWEDMMIIHKCIKDAMNYHLYKMMEGAEGQKVVYQEVLKRFKAQKGLESNCRVIVE